MESEKIFTIYSICLNARTLSDMNFRNSVHCSEFCANFINCRTCYVYYGKWTTTDFFQIYCYVYLTLHSKTQLFWVVYCCSNCPSKNGSILLYAATLPYYKFLKPVLTATSYYAYKLAWIRMICIKQGSYKISTYCAAILICKWNCRIVEKGWNGW